MLSMLLATDYRYLMAYAFIFGYRRVFCDLVLYYNVAFFFVFLILRVCNC